MGQILPNILLYAAGLPLAMGLICLILPDKAKALAKLFSLMVTSASLAASVYIFMKKPSAWPAAAVDPLFIADTLSAFIGMSISFFALLVAVYSFGFVEKSFGRFFGYILMTLGAALGACYSNNLIALLTFWGFLAVTLYLLVNIEGTDKASDAARKALLIIGGTDSLFIFGLGVIWALSGNLCMDKIRLPLNGALPFAAYLAILSAALAKAGAMPFHSWLPDVAENGPVPVTAYLPASLDKLLGIYLLVRVSLKIFIMNGLSNTLLLAVGSATIVVAVILALVQHDLKRLLGYHAVSQVGYMIVGIGTGNPIGIAGGLFHMLNNALYKSCLFLSGGNVEKRTGTSDLSELGALAKYMPLSFAAFLVASLSISGIPPFNGFVSKWMIYQGIIVSARAGNPLWIVWLSCAMFGSALTLASFMKLLHSVFMGRPAKDFGFVKEAPFCMALPVTVLAALCVIFGIFAFLIPIPLFIIPSINMAVTYLGNWTPVMATFLIIVGIIAGLFVYPVLRPKNFRTVSSFVGGEDANKMERVSGAEFYNTIKEMKGLAGIYRKDEAGSLDICDAGRRALAPFTKFFQYLHNGVLPTYLVWCLLGMAGIFVALFFASLR